MEDEEEIVWIFHGPDALTPHVIERTGFEEHMTLRKPYALGIRIMGITLFLSVIFAQHYNGKTSMGTHETSIKLKIDQRAGAGFL